MGNKIVTEADRNLPPFEALLASHCLQAAAVSVSVRARRCTRSKKKPGKCQKRRLSPLDHWARVFTLVSIKALE